MPELIGPGYRNGYPQKILGEHILGIASTPARVNPKELIAPDIVPTTDQIIDVASQAVRTTQRINRYPGAIFTGVHKTAGSGNGNNGSVYISVSPTVMPKYAGLMTTLTLVNRLEPKNIDRVGIYVTSEEKRARSADVSGIGIVLWDGERCQDIQLDRPQLGILSDKAKQELGSILVTICAEADRALWLKSEQIHSILNLGSFS